MRKVVVTEFVSLDGVIEDPGGSEGTKHGGWTSPYWNDEIARIKGEEMAACDALLLGRVTYQGFAAAWPSREGDGADLMNNLPKYVVSTTLDRVEWKNSRLIKGDVAREVANLKQQPGRDILVYGSATLVKTLAQNNLVDTYRLLVYPVVLGSGKRLFGDGVNARLELVELNPAGLGVVELVYQKAEK